MITDTLLTSRRFILRHDCVTTITQQASTGPLRSTRYFTMHSPQATSELALATLLYAIIMFFHTRKTAPKHAKTFHRPSSVPLTIHILVGLFEIFKYHILACRRTVVPDLIDVSACILQVSTNLYLTKSLVRGDLVTRPAYQSVGAIRLFVGPTAWLLSDAHLHRASVKLVNGFAYTRVVITLEVLLGLNDLKSGASIYSHGVFLGGLLSVWEADMFLGIPIYIATVGLFMALNHFLSTSVES